MKEWTMTMDNRSLSAEEIETIHTALVLLRGHLSTGNYAGNADLEMVRELIHEMTFGGAQ
jgi:hypothetical protein